MIVQNCERNMKKGDYRKNPELEKNKEQKIKGEKVFNKVEKFYQQIRQRSYCICTVYHC